MPRFIDGFPQSWGAKVVGLARVTGPASYATYTAPSTGGQDVQALGACGVKIIDFAIGGVSDSGLYRAEVVQIEASTVQGRSLGASQMVLKWWVVATNAAVANAVDLSAETVSILVIGRN